MANLFEILKCEKCGNVVEVLHTGTGPLHCCGQAMKHLAENTVDAAKEKHVPVVTHTETGIKVAVGSVPHPMEEKHFIEWVEVIGENGTAFMHFFKPGQKAEVEFPVKDKNITVREYCNLHGVWKSN
jgi:superoxide reductase